MSIKKEKIAGKMIDVTINSSSLKSASYDMSNENLTVTFKSGVSYRYSEVPMQLFTKFRLAKSQGQFFNKNISPNYLYKKVRTRTK
jgi:hypothetical protein